MIHERDVQRIAAPLDRINLDAALDRYRVSPSGLAHAVAVFLVRRFGGEQASQLADTIVKAVQNERRKIGSGF
jgi:hypothetical protein